MQHFAPKALKSTEGKGLKDKKKLKKKGPKVLFEIKDLKWDKYKHMEWMPQHLAIKILLIWVFRITLNIQ